VCSVHGLYRAFPPPNPPVYVWPQLKPSHGICSFTTTTFGAHRGADQGAGRSTSGRDLLRLLGGSTSAPPPSTAGLLQFPGLTSTRTGRYTAVLDLHQHFRAGIFFPGPAYLCPDRHIYIPAGICGPGWTSTFPGPAYNFPGRHTHFLAGIRVFGPEYVNAGSSLAGIRRSWAGRAIPAGLGRNGGSPVQARGSSSGWAGFSLVPAGPSRPPCSCSGRPPRPPLWAASVGWAGTPASGWAEAGYPRLGLCPVEATPPVKQPPRWPSWAAIVGPACVAVGWAARGQAAPAVRHLPGPCRGESGRSPQRSRLLPGTQNDPVCRLFYRSVSA
jgi:hypothetical protein